MSENDVQSAIHTVTTNSGYHSYIPPDSQNHIAAFARSITPGTLDMFASPVSAPPVRMTREFRCARIPDPVCPMPLDPPELT